MTAPRWLDTTQQQAWRGLLFLSLRVMPDFERTFRADGLLSVQFGILAALSEAPDETLGLSELADHANTSQSRLTHRLRDLVSNGDIRLTTDPEDGRAKNATLTPAGRERIERLAPIHVEDVQRVIFDHLDAKQTAALADALSAIAAGFEK